MTDAGGPDGGWTPPHEGVRSAGADAAWAAPGSAVPAQPVSSPSTPIPMPPPAPLPTAPVSSAAQPGIGAAQPAPGSPTAPLTFRSWRPGIFDLRPLSFGEFLSVPFRAFRFNRGVTVGGPALMSLISVTLTAVATYLLFSDVLLVSDLVTGTSYGDPSVLTWILLGVAILSWFATDMLATAIVLPGVSHAALGERISLGRAWSIVAPRVGHLLLVYLAMFVASMILMALIIVPIVIASDDSRGVVAILSMTIGGALVIVFGVTAGVYLPVVRGAIILERVSAVAGVKRAVHLLKGRFWWTVLILLVVGTITGMVSQIATSAGQVMSFVVGLAMANEQAFAVMLIAGIALGTLLSFIVTYALLGSVHALIYIDARMRREGFQIQLAQAAEARHRSGV